MERLNVFLLTSTTKKTTRESFNAFIDPYLYVNILKSRKSFGWPLDAFFPTFVKKRLPL
jgi:hypothetical protein